MISGFITSFFPNLLKILFFFGDGIIFDGNDDDWLNILFFSGIIIFVSCLLKLNLVDLNGDSWLAFSLLNIFSTPSFLCRKIGFFSGFAKCISLLFILLWEIGGGISLFIFSCKNSQFSFVQPPGELKYLQILFGFFLISLKLISISNPICFP